MEIEKMTITEGVYLAKTETPGLVDLEDTNNFGLHHRVEDVKSASRRTEIIMTGVLLKELFGDGCRLEHEASGKPYLRQGDGTTPAGDISISHCRGAVVVAYRPEGPVGVDVEHERDQVMRIRERFQSDEEMRFTGLSVWKNTLAWTAKEALFKCIPESGVDFRSDLSIDLRELKEGASRQEYTGTAYGRRYRMISLSSDGFVLTVAIPEN